MCGGGVPIRMNGGEHPGPRQGTLGTPPPHPVLAEAPPDAGSGGASVKGGMGDPYGSACGGPERSGGPEPGWQPSGQATTSSRRATLSRGRGPAPGRHSVVRPWSTAPICAARLAAVASPPASLPGKPVVKRPDRTEKPSGPAQSAKGAEPYPVLFCSWPHTPALGCRWRMLPFFLSQTGKAT